MSNNYFYLMRRTSVGGKEFTSVVTRTKDGLEILQAFVKALRGPDENTEFAVVCDPDDLSKAEWTCPE